MTEEQKLGLRERKKLETWRSIRAAALRLINERGYEAVNVDDIAAAANVSRSTFFNYFATKEATVFDPDPMETDAWRKLMNDRPEDEPLWVSLQEIQLGYMSLLADRLAVQKRLKAASPALAESKRDYSDRFYAELREWVASRTPPGAEMQAALQANTALAVLRTAYGAWSPEDGFERFLQLARECFDRAGRGLAPDQYH
ncbi:helix-turn-helix domain-containing protein [Nonomuraea sp. NPDC050786]|uniref:TetR/AcrR family transcriptional regulator n=1 Tax=Nonomuraea sp. NPDC050786 TaxID=3154840 RepID=UPI0033F61EE0